MPLYLLDSSRIANFANIDRKSLILHDLAQEKQKLIVLTMNT